jgi:DNA repair protein RadC
MVATKHESVKHLKMEKWSHPGGKLRELGADTLSDAELLAILISTGIRGKPALAIAQEVLERFGSLTEMSNVPLEHFLEIKGLSDVKIIRIAAAFEITRRLSRGALRDQEE